jgi:hypothetical protein
MHAITRAFGSFPVFQWNRPSYILFSLCCCGDLLESWHNLGDFALNFDDFDGALFAFSYACTQIMADYILVLMV